MILKEPFLLLGDAATVPASTTVLPIKVETVSLAAKYGATQLAPSNIPDKSENATLVIDLGIKAANNNSKPIQRLLFAVHILNAHAPIIPTKKPSDNSKLIIE